MTDLAIDIDQALKPFFAVGTSMIVVTRNAALEPHVARASGVRVLGPDRVAMMLPKATTGQLVADLKANGQIAVSFGDPRTFRSFQLKGRCREVGETSVEDVLECERQLQLFGEGMALFGFSRAQVRNLWLFECWRVEIQVAAAFVQTPGPGAGAKLGADHGH